MIDKSTIERALKQKNIRFISATDSEIRLNCPFEKDTGQHLYLNHEKNTFFCHKCNQRGTWYTLAEMLKVIPAHFSQAVKPDKAKNLPTYEYIMQCHRRLMGQTGTKAIEYLHDRGITTKAIQSFLLGLERKNDIDWLCIPYMKGDKTVNIKYRSLPPAEKEFRRWEGGESVLFNMNAVLPNTKEIVFCEAELDAITLCIHGYTAVASTVGANAFKPEWLDHIALVDKIYLCYDSDTKGQLGAKDAAKRIGYEKCYNIVLPVKDANEYFQDGFVTASDFEEIVAKAERYDIENIVDLQSAMSRLREESYRKAIESDFQPQWVSVSKLTGPYEPGDLIVLSAIPKTGKTTFALNEAYYHAKRGMPVLVYCLEMRPERLAKKVIQIEMNSTEDGLTQSVLDSAFSRLADIPLYFGYNYKDLNIANVSETIRLGVRRYGFGMVVFDNLHYMARSITNQTQEVGMLSKSFKLLAEELQIPIILIAQPRKVADNQVMGMMDLKDSSSIGADADTIIILYRHKCKSKDGTAEASFERSTIVRVEASRFRSGGETVLDFDAARSKFREEGGAEW